MNMLDAQRIEYFESLGMTFPERVTASDYSLHWSIKIDRMEHGLHATLEQFNDDDTISLEFTINKGIYFGTVTDSVKNVKQAVFNGLIAFRTVH